MVCLDKNFIRVTKSAIALTMYQCFFILPLMLQSKMYQATGMETASNIELKSTQNHQKPLITWAIKVVLFHI